MNHPARRLLQPAAAPLLPPPLPTLLIVYAAQTLVVPALFVLGDKVRCPVSGIGGHRGLW